MGRKFVDSEGRSKTFTAKVYDFCDPFWRVEYSDGDWEKLTRREVEQGMGGCGRPAFLLRLKRISLLPIAVSLPFVDKQSGGGVSAVEEHTWSEESNGQDHLDTSSSTSGR